MYITLYTSLYIYVPPCICPFHAHFFFMCMYSYMNVTLCVSLSVYIMLKI